MEIHDEFFPVFKAKWKGPSIKPTISANIGERLSYKYRWVSGSVHFSITHRLFRYVEGQIASLLPKVYQNVHIRITKFTFGMKLYLFLTDFHFFFGHHSANQFERDDENKQMRQHFGISKTATSAESTKDFFTTVVISYKSFSKQISIALYRSLKLILTVRGQTLLIAGLHSLATTIDS